MLSIKYSEFYKYKEMVDFLFEAKKEYSKFIELKALVTSPEEREVYLVAITDPETGLAEQKGAYFVQACVHGQEGAGTTEALYLIKQLLEEEKYRELLKKIVFYIIPRVNPDGAEYAIAKQASIRSRFMETYGKNRLIPKDLNGDGYILSMRWEDPAGLMKEDKVDPRIMVKRQPGDKGPFYQVITEGIIEGYEEAPFNLKEIKYQRTVDFNRNWPINWNPENPVSSLYPFSEPEMQAVGEFMVKHPNIFAGIDLHCGCNGILRPSMKSDSEMNQEDLEFILNIGKVAEDMTGFPLIHEREYKEPWRQPMILHGNSNDWSYFKMGISHYVIELGNGFNCAGISTSEYLNADTLTRETNYMRKVLSYHDERRSRLFVPWEKFQHPQLGLVEIGGLVQGNGYYMYPPIMKEIAPKVSEFLIYHAKRYPELIVSNVEVVEINTSVAEKHKNDERHNNDGEKIYRIRASVGNIGGFGTKVMKAGGSMDSNYPVIANLILPEGAEILSRVKSFEIGSLGALGDSEIVEWFVKLPAYMVGKEPKQLFIEASHPRAGIYKFAITL